MRFDGADRKGGLFWLRVAAAIVLSWSLVLVDSRLGSVTGSVRSEISELVVKPARLVAQLPTAAWTTTSDYFRSRAELIAAKQDLEEQLLRERNRHNQLVHIERENVQLRRLAGARAKIEPDAHIAEVVNTASLPFINRIVLDKGSSQGLLPSQGVFTDEGVIGRLSRVDGDTSQALLLTDKRFWIATRLEHDGTLVLLQGDGGNRMRIRFLPSDVDVKSGDKLVTAGGDGPFPGGLPVAVVSEISLPEGMPFQEGVALPVASIRQESAVLVHSPSGEPVPDSGMPVDRSGAVPANFSPEVLP